MKAYFSTNIKKVFFIIWIIFSLLILYFYKNKYNNLGIISLSELSLQTFEDLYSETCEKTIIFSLNNSSGLGHIINILLNYMIWAHFTNRSFFINDNNWNYGLWFNYFESTKFAHKEYNNIQILYNDNKKCNLPNIENIQFLGSDITLPHLYVQNRWNALPNIYNYTNNYINSTIKDVEKYEKIYKTRYDMLKKFWILKPELKEIVDRRISQLNKNYIAIHIRRGDKISELQSKKYTPLIMYYKYIQKIFDDKDYPYFNNKTPILIVSDDTTIINNLKNDKPYWNFVTTWPIYSLPYINKGHDQNIFNELNHEVRQKIGIRFIVELEMMKNAEFVICTYSSNVGRLVAQLKGWDNAIVKKKVISLDNEWNPY